MILSPHSEQLNITHLAFGSSLWSWHSDSFSWSGGAVELGDDHGVAEGHEDAGYEEHDDVDQGVVDLLGEVGSFDEVSSVWVTCINSRKYFRALRGGNKQTPRDGELLDLPVDMSGRLVNMV